MTDAIYPLASAVPCACLCLRARAHHWSHRVLAHHGVVHHAPELDTLTCINDDTSHGYGGGGGAYTPVYGGYGAAGEPGYGGSGGWPEPGGDGFSAGAMPWISGGPGVVVLPGVIESPIGQPLTPIHPAPVPEPATWVLGIIGAVGLVATRYARGKV